MLRFAITAIIVSTLGIGAGAALAEDRVPQKQTVSFDNAELNTEAGAARAYSRLKTVAIRVCESEGAAPRWVLQEDRDCEENAINDAVAELGNRDVARLHESRTDRPQREASRVAAR